MHPYLMETLVAQRREQLLADAARSHRAKTRRATRRIRTPRTDQSCARVWLGSMSLALRAILPEDPPLCRSARTARADEPRTRTGLEHRVGA